jgi:glycosyltransferase involved in cell wall biosynthesis
MFTDKVFVHTQNAKNKLLSNTLIKKPVETVAHPILIRNTKPKTYTKGKLKLLCFGFIVWDKGIDVAVKAFGGVKNVSLTIVGSVPQTAMRKQHLFLERIKALTAKYRNVKLINRFVSEEEKAGFYAQCDFVVMPYRFVEQSGIIAEAWSFQRIPICSDIKSLREDTENGRYGILFKAEDVSDLKNKTLTLAKDQKKQKKILTNIKQVIKDRDFDKLSKEFLKRLK